MIHLFLLLEACMSILCFVCFGVDKLLAKWHKRRIRERTLLGLMWLCGAPGGLLSMSIFRHKTAHPSFWLTGVCALLVQLLAAAGIVYLSFR